MRNDFPYFFSSWNAALWTIIITAVIGSVVLSGTFSDALFSVFLLPIFFLLIWITCSLLLTYTNRSYIVLLFVWSLTIRLLSVYIFSEVMNNYIGIPFLSYKDDYVYNEVAHEIAERWRGFGIGFYDDIRFSKGAYSGFPNFSAALIYIFGDSMFVPRIGNAFLSAFSCVTAYKICRSYAPLAESKVVGIIFMFSPLLITFASLQLKDTLLLFLTLTAIHANIKILTGRINIKTLLQFAVSVFFMAFIRTAAIVPIIGAYLFTLLLSAERNKILKLALAIVLVYCVIYALDHISLITGMDIDSYFDSRYQSMSGRTIKDTNAGIAGTSLAKLVGAPLYLLAGFFLPPPLIISLPDAETINYELFGLLFHYSLLPFLCIAFFRAIKNRKQMVIPFFLALVFLLFKVGQANSVMSILSGRQSLSTMTVMYLLLPLCLKDIGKKNTRTVIVAISIIIMYAYAMIRLYSRGLL